jgi:ArsR family transcriptional regulator, arsenate/arsenite/antimonite-responsive transcriptional repressor
VIDALMTYGLTGAAARPDDEIVVDSKVLASTGVDPATCFAALADPLRLAIVRALADGELCVCDVRERVPIAGNLLSYHLRILREAGLVTRTRRGRSVDYRLDGDGFTKL